MNSKSALKYLPVKMDHIQKIQRLKQLTLLSMQVVLSIYWISKSYTIKYCKRIIFGTYNISRKYVFEQVEVGLNYRIPKCYYSNTCIYALHL